MNFIFPDSFWFWLIPSLIFAASVYGFVFLRIDTKSNSVRNVKNGNRPLSQKKIVEEKTNFARSGSIYFGAGSSEIESEFFQSLDLLAKNLKETKGWNLKIQGWTDRFGSPATNRRLSLERAKKIRRYLCGKWKFPKDSIFIRGMGVEPRSMGPEKARRADWEIVL
ncbi:OmpA family protein [Leptospira sp. 201903070]|uniref:OmpA family protein n=1 Tax=Leptospira ainlahdjerensis TaxID=2810033 RepID=A0ABS2UHY9_9LEPT|nr:OmpA family protein [Leptospira ainlahdjerensis]MBM9579628.1 OmpA family protein [Leptospira ainlahdjerensis]